MYGVLYAVSPELFPAKDRGTGNGLTATATRVFGIIVGFISLPLRLRAATYLRAGACHRAVRQPGDGRSRVCLGRADYRERCTRAPAAVRAAGQGVDLTRRSPRTIP